MSKKAMQQALEALQNIDKWLYTIGQKGLRDYEADAATALRDALIEESYDCPICKRSLPIKEGVITHDNVPHPEDFIYEGGDKARDLLNRCLCEMSYAGWNKPVKDNIGRWDVFSAVLGYLHPPVEGETVKKVKWKIALKLSGESKSSMDMTGYIGTQAKDTILEILERDFQEEPIKQMIGLTVQEIGAIWDADGTGYIPEKQLQFYMDCETKLREKNI